MEKARKQLKSIVISEVTLIHNEGMTDEYEATDFVVEVSEHENGSTQGVFQGKEEAEAYASDVAKRPLRPFNFAKLLDPR